MTLNQKDLRLLGNLFATKEDLKQLKSDLFDKLDSISKEMVAMREEQTIISHKVSGHEDRIISLEGIHPDGKHVSA